MAEKPAALTVIDNVSWRVKRLYSDLSNASDAKKETFNEKINLLVTKIDRMENKLGIKVVTKDRRSSMATDIWLLTLDDELAEHRKQLSKRIAEVENLLGQQDALLDVLGEKPRNLSKMAKPDDIGAFRNHVQDLQELREARLDEAFDLRYSILTEMKVRGIEPDTSEERQLLKPTDQRLTAEIMETLRFKVMDVTDKVEGLDNDMEFLRKGISANANEMQTMYAFIDRRAKKLDASEHSYEVLAKQLRCCESLYAMTWKILTEELCKEVHKYWKLTKSQMDAKHDFVLSINEGPWKTLEKLENEVDTLKKFYETNKRLYDLYDCRTEFWQRLVALENKASDSDQDYHRKSPREDLELTTINKTLLNLDGEIKKLANEFLEKHNRPFEIYGQDILKVIADPKLTDENLSLGSASAVTAYETLPALTHILAVLNSANLYKPPSSMTKRKATGKGEESSQDLTGLENSEASGDQPKRKKEKKDKKKKKHHKSERKHKHTNIDKDNDDEPPANRPLIAI